jgi:hypothetical protein
MRDMDQYMTALDIIAKINHIDDFVEEQRVKEEQGQSDYLRNTIPLDQNDEVSEDDDMV